MLERILIPLDGSPLAEAILPQVGRVLHLKDAEVILLRAIPLIPVSEGDVSSAMELFEDQAKTYLQRVQDGLEQEGVRVRSITQAGAPAETVLHVAGKEHVSLIAMSTHGKTGLARWVFGSVAEKVLRASELPVLLLRSFGEEKQSAAPADELRLQKILMPVELSDLSLEIVPHVAELAGLFGAKVLILNVCGNAAKCDVPVHQMTRAHELLAKSGVAAEPIMRQGDPAVEILNVCEEVSADLIAMATHGRSGVSRWMLGSVAEKVLRAADVPLLVVRTARRCAPSRPLPIISPTLRG